MANFKVIQDRDQVALNASEPVFQKGEPVVPFSNDQLKALGGYADKLNKQAEESDRVAEYTYTNRLKNMADELKNNAIHKVVSVEGENVFPVSDKVNKDLSYQYDKLLQSAPDRYRYKAENILEGNKVDARNVFVGHQYKEQNKVIDNIEKDRVKFISEQIPLAVFEAQKFNQYRSDLLETVEKSVRRKMGGSIELGTPVSPEVEKEILAQKVVANSGVLANTIESLVVGKNVGFARDLYSNIKAELLNADNERALKALEKGEDDNVYDRAKQVVDSTLLIHKLNSTSAREYIRKVSGSDGKLYNAAIAMYENEYNSREKFRADKAQDTFASFQDSVRKGTPLNTAMSMLDIRDRTKARQWYVSMSKGEEIPVNSALENSLYDMYVKNPSKFSSIPLGQYAFDLPQSRLDHYKNLQKDLLDANPAKMQFSDFSDVVGRHLMNNYGKASEEEAASFRAMAAKKFYEVQALYGDKRVSRSEFAKALDESIAFATSTIEDTRPWYRKLPIISSPPSPTDLTRTNKVLDLKDEGFDNINDASNLKSRYPHSSWEVARQSLIKVKGSEPSNEEIIKLLNDSLDKVKIRK